MQELLTPQLEQALAARTQRGTSCWIWTGAVDKNGYGLFRVQAKTTRIARFIWQVANDRKLGRTEHVLHSCDNPACVNPAHLSVGSHAENMADMASKARAHKPVGDLNGRALLTAEKAATIRERAAAGVSVSRLGRIYGVSRGAIYHLLAGHTWNQ